MADLERRLADLDAMQVELIGALNDTNALHGLFIDATARRLSSIAEEAERGAAWRGDAQSARSSRSMPRA